MALATKPGKSALALVRLSGAGSIGLVARCFSRPDALLAAPGHSLVHGRILDPENGEHIDEVLIAVFRGPRSVTGEDQLELSCHGSPAVIDRLLACLEKAGFAPALPGEFSFRAFANGKSDLVRAEAIDEIVAARSDGARAAALSRLEGGLSRRLASARASLVGLVAEAEVRLDHAEEDGSPTTIFPRDALANLRDGLDGLVSTWKASRLYGEGAKMVLAGRPNAGKSSLFNLFLREERAIVSPEPGTTRDWIEASLEVAGFPVRLVDTAGLRWGSSGVEASGIDRSRLLISGADVLLYLVDASRGEGEEDRTILRNRPDALRIWNKIDLPDSIPAPPGWIPVSAAEGQGFSDLFSSVEKALRSLAGMDPERSNNAEQSRLETAIMIANKRQKALLERAIASLDEALIILDASTRGENRSQWLDAACLELRDAADALGEITGEISTPEVLDAIFSGFCLGK
jgi:tRNA modification GTPase